MTVTLRAPLRPVLRGLRDRRRLPALAGQDHDRVRRPPLLPDHDEPSPAAHQRVVRRERDRARQERRRRATSCTRSCSGMSVPDVSGSCIANLEVESLVHRFPTFHGDTIYAETRVVDKVESSSKPDRGIVTVESKGFNQRGEEVCYFRRKLMVWMRSAAPAAPPSLRGRRLGLSPPARSADARRGPRASPPRPSSPSAVRAAALPVAPDPRPLGRARERGDAPADPAGPGRRALPPLPGPFPTVGGLCRAASGECCGPGPASATTAGPATSTGRPWPWSSATAGTVPDDLECLVGAARRRALHGPGRARLRLRDRRRRRRRQRAPGSWPGPWPADRLSGASGPGRGRHARPRGSGMVVEPVPDGDRRRVCTARHRRVIAVRWRRAVRLGRCRRAPPIRRRPRSRQTRFVGSDRQGRGRLVAALRSGPVPPGRLAAPAVGPTTPPGPGGWPMPSWPRAWPAGDRAAC